MITKRTLTMDDKVIEAAKRYAEINQTSVSVVVETYLEKLTSNSQKSQLNGIVAELAGSLKSIDEETLTSYPEYLRKKYK
jgi:hypothetical protein